MAGLNGGFEPAWPQPLRVQILAHLARIRARAADINSPDKLQRKGQAAQGGQAAGPDMGANAGAAGAGNADDDVVDADYKEV